MLIKLTLDGPLSVVARLALGGIAFGLGAVDRVVVSGVRLAWMNEIT
jgi:hypothetical protein